MCAPKRAWSSFLCELGRLAIQPGLLSSCASSVLRHRVPSVRGADWPWLGPRPAVGSPGFDAAHCMVCSVDVSTPGAAAAARCSSRLAQVMRLACLHRGATSKTRSKGLQRPASCLRHAPMSCIECPMRLKLDVPLISCASRKFALVVVRGSECKRVSTSTGCLSICTCLVPTLASLK